MGTELCTCECAAQELPIRFHPPSQRKESIGVRRCIARGYARWQCREGDRLREGNGVLRVGRALPGGGAAPHLVSCLSPEAQRLPATFRVSTGITLSQAQHRTLNAINDPSLMHRTPLQSECAREPQHEQQQQHGQQPQ